MKRADRTVVVDRQSGVTELFDVVLLAGSPRRLTLRLPPGIAAEAVVEVDGERWTVADVRPADDGPSQLICIHAE